MQGNLFSESWYRVAELRLSMAYTVRVQKQFFRGSTYYVLHDPFNNRFFRTRPEAYEFLIRLNNDKTVEEVWEERLHEDPVNTPSQDEVIRLLSQLHHANLLFFRNSGDSERLFERFSESKKKFIANTFLSILFLKIPLWDPEQFLKKTQLIIKALISIPGLIVWILAVVSGAYLVLSNTTELWNQSQGMLAPSNLIFLYLCLIFLKIFHELGHAAMTKRFGGEVHVMGVMFLVFTPLPYMDASSSWAFRNKWHRILVGAAGIIVELFIASIAAWFWVYSGNELIRSLAFNVMIIGSISSLFFNGNPLTRLDSYYMLSDWLEIPNLAERSKNQWIYCVEKYAFGFEDLSSLASSNREGLWLLIYGLLSFLYRIFISVAIALFVLDQWFEVGFFILGLSIFTWILRPIWKFFQYLLTDPRILKNKRRTYAMTACSLLLFFFLLGVYPVSNSIQAPGVLHSDNFLNLYAPVPGLLKKVDVYSGQFLRKGEKILTLSDPELDLELREADAQLEESQALLLKAREVSIADVAPIEERLAFLRSKISRLNKKQNDRALLASHDGYWIAPELQIRLDTWIPKGFLLGSLIPSKSMQFVGVVSQEQASDLFTINGNSGEIKLRGREEFTLVADSFRVIPYRIRELPSVALGWFGGGNIQVTPQDGLTTQESFFELTATVNFTGPDISLYHGRTGVIRIQLPPQTIMEQILRSLRQLFQKRYKIT